LKVYLDIILHYTVERIIDEDTANLGWLFKVYLTKALDEGLTSDLWCLTPLSTIFQLYRGG
jgi:hypothetical protein